MKITGWVAMARYAYHRILIDEVESLALLLSTDNMVVTPDVTPPPP
jgi:hypothetical protein